MSKELSDLALNFLELIHQDRPKEARAFFLQHPQEINAEIYSPRFVAYQRSLPKDQQERFKCLYLLYMIFDHPEKKEYSSKKKKR